MLNLSGMMNEKILSTISRLQYLKLQCCKVPTLAKIVSSILLSSDQSLAAILTQKDDDNNEAPISFMSTNIQGAELNYPAIDKQAYAIYKAVKYFRSYILKNHTKVIVPHPAV
jgi:hypothetical protein